MGLELTEEKTIWGQVPRERGETSQETQGELKGFKVGCAGMRRSKMKYVLAKNNERAHIEARAR